MPFQNNNPMHGVYRAICGAKTRSGGACKTSPMTNGRCRMHGGKSTGAPKGNQNALKHGRYSNEMNMARNYSASFKRAFEDLKVDL